MPAVVGNNFNPVPMRFTALRKDVLELVFLPYYYYSYLCSLLLSAWVRSGSYPFSRAERGNSSSEP